MLWMFQKMTYISRTYFTSDDVTDLQDDVAPALFLQLLDINSILANQLAWENNSSQVMSP